MPKLIKNGELAIDEWELVETDRFDLDKTLQGKWILPLELFKKAVSEGYYDCKRIGVSLSSEASIEDIADYLAELRIVALKFTLFTDGRSFSQARILREHFDFSGEIRAIDNFLHDQLFYLSRCGVNAFLLPDDAEIGSVLKSLSDFSESYQAACDESQPLFRRRA